MRYPFARGCVNSKYHVIPLEAYINHIVTVSVDASLARHIVSYSQQHRKEKIDKTRKITTRRQ